MNFIGKLNYNNNKKNTDNNINCRFGNNNTR